MTERNAEMEAELIKRAKHGDSAAYGELVSWHYDGVIRVVYHLCGDAQVAQDAAQDAFIRAWSKLGEYQPRGPFRSWVYRIAANAALDALRRKPGERLDDGEGPGSLTERTPGPEAAYLEKERAQALQAAVRALPAAARAVLVLREYGELSYEEIAAALDIPAGTVMSRLSYARGRLRELLRAYQRETERDYVALGA